jgi:hypothetical protein
MQCDPISYQAGDMNLYRALGNEPLGWTDPSGEMKKYPVSANDPECRRLQKRIENLMRDIVKRTNELKADKLGLPWSFPGAKAFECKSGHYDLILQDVEFLIIRIEQYISKCIGGDPLSLPPISVPGPVPVGVPGDSPPVIVPQRIPPGVVLPPLHLPRTLPRIDTSPRVSPGFGGLLWLFFPDLCPVQFPGKRNDS